MAQKAAGFPLSNRPFLWLMAKKYKPHPFGNLGEARYGIQRMPCFSFASAKTRLIVLLCIARVFASASVLNVYAVQFCCLALFPFFLHHRVLTGCALQARGSGQHAAFSWNRLIVRAKAGILKMA